MPAGWPSLPSTCRQWTAQGRRPSGRWRSWVWPRCAIGPAKGGGEGFTLVISGTNALSTTAQALETWLYHGGIRGHRDQPMGHARPGGCHPDRPSRAGHHCHAAHFYQRPPADADHAGLSVGRSGLLAGHHPCAGSGRRRPGLPGAGALDYPAYSGIVRTWLETATPQAVQREMSPGQWTPEPPRGGEPVLPQGQPHARWRLRLGRHSHDTGAQMAGQTGSGACVG